MPLFLWLQRKPQIISGVPENKTSGEGSTHILDVNYFAPFFSAKAVLLEGSQEFV